MEEKIVLHMRNKQLFRGGKLIELTIRETTILGLLTNNRLILHEEFMKYTGAKTKNNIIINISRIKKKTGLDIIPIPGRGYICNDEILVNY